MRRREHLIVLAGLGIGFGLMGLSRLLYALARAMDAADAAQAALWPEEDR